VEINERQLVATLLDIRTCKCIHLTPEQRSAAQAALSEYNVKFFIQKRAMERKEESTTVAECPLRNPREWAPAAAGFDIAASDEEESLESPAKKPKEDVEADDAKEALCEFKRVFKNWMRFDVDWRAEFQDLPEHGASLSKADVITLIKLDVGPLYIKLGLAVEPRRKGGSQFLLSAFFLSWRVALKARSAP
jgi:hypothetical protein